MYRIIIIGGAGDMAQVAARTFLSQIGDVRLVLADYDLAKAEKVAASYGSPEVEAAFVDIYDPAVLREVIRGSDLVANCTGPYYRTGRPVVEACMDEKVNYIDLGDDEDSALELLACTNRPKERASPPSSVAGWRRGWSTSSRGSAPRSWTRWKASTWPG